PVYLLVADLLNTTLSAILTFSDHVLYQYYLEVPRLFGTTALSDQTCAGVIMWVPGSLAFLVPAALIAIECLSPRRLLVRPPKVHRNPVCAPLIHPVAAWIFQALGGHHVQPLLNTRLSQILINTPLQRGVWKPDVLRNRFNSFAAAMETVKTVSN